MGNIYYYNSDQYDNGMEPTDTVYSDRLFQWDHEKYNKTRRRLFGNEGQGWSGIPPKDVEKFLQEYMCDDSIRICRIEQSENRATGNPLWRFDFIKVHRQITETPAIKAEPILDNETVVGYEGTCEACGGAIDKYDKFTEEIHCINCGWTGGIL